MIGCSVNNIPRAFHSSRASTEGPGRPGSESWPTVCGREGSRLRPLTQEPGTRPEQGTPRLTAGPSTPRDWPCGVSMTATATERSRSRSAEGAEGSDSAEERLHPKRVIQSAQTISSAVELLTLLVEIFSKSVIRALISLSMIERVQQFAAGLPPAPDLLNTACSLPVCVAAADVFVKRTPES